MVKRTYDSKPLSCERVTLAEEETSTERLVDATEFKRNCSRYIRSVADSGQALVITKNGKPVSKLVPYAKPMSLTGLFKDDCQILGEIMEPIDVEWDAMKDDNEEDYYELSFATPTYFCGVPERHTIKQNHLDLIEELQVHHLALVANQL